MQNDTQYYLTHVTSKPSGYQMDNFICVIIRMHVRVAYLFLCNNTAIH